MLCYTERIFSLVQEKMEKINEHRTEAQFFLCSDAKFNAGNHINKPQIIQ